MTVFLVAERLLGRVRAAHAVMLLGFAVVVVFVGGVVFAITNHEGVGTGLYWAVTTATTVGYGDVTPKNGVSRVVAVLVMLLTIPVVGAAFALLAGTTAVSYLRRILGLETHLPQRAYTLVYGDDPVVPSVLTELLKADSPVVLVAAKRPAGLAREVTYVAGDPTDDEVIKASRPEGASRVLIACDEDADTLIVAVSLRTRVPALEVYALSESPRVASALRDLGVHHTLSSTELVGHTLAKSLESPSAGDLVLQLVDTTSYAIRERVVVGDLLSRPLSQIRGSSSSLVLGIARGDRVDVGIGTDPVLTAGDRIVELVLPPST